MMPFDERWWDVASKICHATPGLFYTEIEKKEGTLAWRLACALQAAYDAALREEGR
jgi:hypothetical protein